MRSAPVPKPTTIRILPSVFAGMCLVELALLLGIVLHHKWSGHTAGFDWAGRHGIAVLALLTVALAGAMLLWLGLRSKRRAAGLTIAINVVTVLLLAGTAEVLLRMAVALKPAVTSILPRGLLPRDWHELVAVNLAHLQSGDVSYMRADPDLGWTVGESRRSDNGLYASSTEGIRSPEPGMSYAAVTGKRRVTLVGDSFAFSEEVDFQDSLGHHLQRALGEDFQVLNFGVPGYGVDQSYLRYRTDVIAWKPEITILVFTWHDLQRTLSVYTSIAFPTWKMPFAKPRFVLADGKLSLKNVPAPSPEVLLAEPDVSALPFIKYEPTYVKTDWEWHWYHSFYIIRFALSLIPNWPENDDALHDEQLGIHAAILRSFVDSARADGITPIVAYFPTKGSGELDRPAGNDSTHPEVREVFEAAGIEYVNGADCIRNVDRSTLYRPRGHYAGTGNAAMAACLVVYLKDGMTSRSGQGSALANSYR